MIPPVDATLLSALQQQYQALDTALARLDIARASLLPGPATFWRGTARNAYNSAIETLATTVDTARASLQLARAHTGQALSRMVAGA